MKLTIGFKGGHHQDWPQVFQPYGIRIPTDGAQECVQTSLPEDSDAALLTL